MFSVKPENAAALCCIIPVCSAKMSRIPLKIRVFSCTSGEVKTCPCPDLLRSADILITVRLQFLLRHDLLCLVCTHTLIENDIADHLNPFVLKGRYRLQVILSGSVLCRNCSLLVKLAEVIQIVYIITDTGGSSCPFISRRKPDHIDTRSFQRCRLRSQLLPMQSVFRKIPLKALHHCSVIHIFTSSLFCI